MENIIDEARESLKENLKNRIASPFYGAFIISWLAWNWEVWYVTFFVDSDLLLKTEDILKVDYISAIYKWSSFWDATYSLSHIFILPFLSALAIVYLMPEITCKFYDKSLETENKNKLAKNKQGRAFLEAIGEKLDAEKTILIKQAEVKKEKIKSEKSQEEKWDEEYKNFKSGKYYNSFKSIKEIVYGNDNWVGESISFNVRAYFDSNGIIQNFKGNSSRIELTEKGKYFMKKYSEEN